MRRLVANRPENNLGAVGITEYTVPSAVNGTYSWIHNSSQWITAHDHFVVYVGANREVRIARRMYERAWLPSVNLQTATGSVFTAAVTEDSHNVMAVALDNEGYIHVSGNMHAVPLLYMRSVRPYDMTEWTSGMVGTEESNATYPKFIMSKTNQLYFWYRDGFSGDGNWVLNKYNAPAKTWSRVAVVLQGSVENVNAYPLDVAVDRTSGRWHTIWTIRKDFSSQDENEHLYYAYTDDEGVTWKKTDGTPYALPITWASGEKIVDLPGGAIETVYNGGGLDIDSSGNPHGVTLVQDTGQVARYRHVWLAAGVWHYDLFMASTNSSGRVPQICCWPDGTNWMIFQNGAGGRANSLRYIDMSTLVEGVITSTNMLHYLPAIKFSPERNTLFVFAPRERQDGLLVGDPDLSAQTSAPIFGIRR